MKPELSVKKTIEILEKKGIGKSRTNYRLKDWGVSRQRYWDVLLEIAYDKEGNIIPIQKVNYQSNSTKY